VPFRDYNTLAHLDLAVEHTPRDRDTIVLTIRLIRGQGAGSSQELAPEELFTDYEQMLFTRVVAVAERQGRTVKLLVVPAINVFDGVAQTAIRLDASEIVVGESATMSPIDQAHLLGEAWDRTPHGADLVTRLTVLGLNGQVRRFSLGAHAPELSAEDIARIHQLWIEAARAVGPSIHHRDVVSAALAALELELRDDREKALSRLREHMRP